MQLLSTNDKETSSISGLPAAYAVSSKQVAEQLSVVSAQHAFYADRTDATLAFFDAHR